MQCDEIYTGIEHNLIKFYMKQITQEQINAVVNYLATKQFSEVYQIINMLWQLPEENIEKIKE